MKCINCGAEFSYSVLPIHQDFCITVVEEFKKEEVQSQEETPTRKDLNAKLKSLGYEGDLRKLSDEDAIIEIEKLENK